MLEDFRANALIISGCFNCTQQLIITLKYSLNRDQGQIECEHLKNNVTLDCEKTEEKLMHRYMKYSILFSSSKLYVRWHS